MPNFLICDGLYAIGHHHNGDPDGEIFSTGHRDKEQQNKVKILSDLTKESNYA